MNYPRSTWQRARRAIACSPFQASLLTAMRVQGVALTDIAGVSGVAHHYTNRALSERAAERALLWLIQVGLLRREVDGQGLTDSFRLTPLGRLMAEQWQQQGERFRNISWHDRLWNWARRILSGVL